MGLRSREKNVIYSNCIKIIIIGCGLWEATNFGDPTSLTPHATVVSKQNENEIISDFLLKFDDTLMMTFEKYQSQIDTYFIVAY